MKAPVLLLLIHLSLSKLAGCEAQVERRRLRIQDDGERIQKSAVDLVDDIVAAKLSQQSLNYEHRDEMKQNRDLGIGFETPFPSVAPTIDLDLSFNMSMSFSMSIAPDSPAPTTPSPTVLMESPTEGPVTHNPTFVPTFVSATDNPVATFPTTALPPAVITPQDTPCVDESTSETLFFETFEESYGPFEPTGTGAMRVPSEMFSFQGIWSVRLVGNESDTDFLFTPAIPIMSERVQLTFFYLPNAILDLPASLQKGLSVDFMLHDDGVWMTGKRLVVGEDFENDNTVWNFYCLQLDLPAGPNDVAFRFRVNGDRRSDQVFIDNVSLLAQ